MIRNLRLVLVLLSFSMISFAQQSTQQSTQKATSVVKAEYMRIVPSIASQIENGNFIKAIEINKEVNVKRRDANVAVPGKGLPIGNDPLWEKQQNTRSNKQNREPIITWDAASSGTTPTDPTGAVGPDHYINSWNSAYRIWDKEGNPLIDAASLATIFPGETYGDPIVVYDRWAERFIIMEFSNTPNGLLIAVCQGPDPVNDGWFTYRFNTGSFPDYPKLTIWSDGYYLTSNKNSSSAGTSEVVYACERDKMIVGNEDAKMIGFPLPTISTSGFFSPLGFNVNGSELPPAGGAPIVYMQDDSWGGVSEDHLKIWTINMDWDDVNNSEITDPQIIPTAPFDGLFDGGSFSNLPQPSGGDIDALQATIMYMAQYRRFFDHNSVVFNFVVDLDGSDDLAGIRWYELRQTTDGEPWTIYQEGTYAQSEGLSAFAGTMGMDANGNIALAYTVVSEEVFPSLRYTGRLDGDELGVMTFEEGEYAAGTMSDPATRYGDYSQMTIDPTDDVTFWSIGEYFKNGARKNGVGAFKLAPTFENDVAIIAINSPVDGLLTTTEDITITIRNFGLETLTDVPVSYTVNGGTAIEEVFAGPLASYESIEFTFATTANMSTLGEVYEIVASAELEGDQQIENNSFTKSVMYLYSTDLGVKDIISPISAEGLTNEETIIAIVKNYGTQNHSGSFNITFSVDDGSTVYEQFIDDLAAGEEMEFTFNNTGDFSSIGNHTIAVRTWLSSDQNDDNNIFEKEVVTEMCFPLSNCGSGSGIRAIILGDIENVTNCEEDGYGDFTDQNTTLYRGYDHELVIASNQGDQFINVWIDYNDNFVFDIEELVIDNEVLSQGQGSGTYLDTLDLNIPAEAVLGEHMMRAKVSWGSFVPDNSCDPISWGETEDYMLTIDSDVATPSIQANTGDMRINYLDNNNFKVELDSKNLTETLFITVHDIMGRKLIQNRVYNIGGQYEFNFDMSYSKPGIYLVRLGNSKFGKVKKIVVR